MQIHLLKQHFEIQNRRKQQTKNNNRDGNREFIGVDYGSSIPQIRSPDTTTEAPVLPNNMTRCVDVLRVLRNDKHAGPFLQAVDVKIIPHYYDVIKYPTDLSSIKSKLENGAYANPRSFEWEVRTMFANAYQYNRRGSAVHQKCRALEKKFNKFFPPAATRKSLRRRTPSRKYLDVTRKVFSTEGDVPATSGKRRCSSKYCTRRKRARCQNTTKANATPRSFALREQIKSLKQMIQEIKDDMRHRAFALPRAFTEKNDSQEAEKEAQTRRQFVSEFQTLAPRQQMHIFTILNKNMFLYKDEGTRNIDVDLSSIDGATFKKIQAYLKGVKVRAKKKKRDKLLTKSVQPNAPTVSKLVIAIDKPTQEPISNQQMTHNVISHTFDDQDGETDEDEWSSESDTGTDDEVLTF